MERSPRMNAKYLVKRQRKIRNRKIELEKLKAEYARIKELNERIIEKKMRQVRLNRLFKEIEEIREMSAYRARLRKTQPQRPKTEEETRIENLKRSRELGQEYSKLNALMKYTDFIEDLRAQEIADIASQKLYLLERRLAYGNTVSKTNAEKKNTNAAKKEWNVHKPEQSRLQNRLSYGNTHSYINVLLGLKQKNRNILAELLREELTTSDEPSDISRKEAKAELKAKKKASLKNELSKHQELLEEIKQLQKTRHEIKGGSRSDRYFKAVEAQSEIGKKEMEKQDEFEKSSVSSRKTVESKVTEESKEGRDVLPITASSSGDELIATPRFIQESLISKKQEIAAQGLQLALPEKTGTTKSCSDLEALFHYANSLERYKENITSAAPVEPKIQMKPQKHSKFFEPSNLSFEVQQIKSLFRSVLSQEKLQQVAEEFVPGIRNAIEKEVSLPKNLQDAMAHQPHSTTDLTNQYMF